jgi:2'-5' RNA ligase
MDLTNSYAIVAYVADPVARFADRLRRELAPGCPHRAHISILPPRLIRCPPLEAAEFARPLVAQFEPFEVRLGGIEQFCDTKVIYLSVASGTTELTAMHDVLNTGVLQQTELYRYVPHITLGQDLPPEDFERALELSRRRWKEFGTPPPLQIETVTFVERQPDGIWKNLAEMGLGRVPAIG